MTHQVLKQSLAALFGLGIALSATAASADVDYNSFDDGVTVLTDTDVIFAGDGVDSGPE